MVATGVRRRDHDVARPLLLWRAAAAALVVIGASVSVAGAKGGDPAVAPLLERPAGPSDVRWTRLPSVSAPALLSRTSARCPGELRSWRSGGGAVVVVTVWTCERRRDAAVALWQRVRASKLEEAREPPADRLPGAFTTERVRASRLGGHVRSSTLLFARSRHVVRVESHAAIAAPGAAAPVAQLAARQRAILPAVVDSSAREQSRRLGGAPILVEPMVFQPGLILAPVVAVFLLVILPWRYLRDPGRRRRYRVQGR